jgi:predicted RNase H-like HicB family nuclease
MKERDRYLKIVEWSDENQYYVGSVPGWIGACCHGEEEEKVYKELCKIVDEWIEIYQQRTVCHYLPQPLGRNIQENFNFVPEVNFIMPLL